MLRTVSRGRRKKKSKTRDAQHQCYASHGIKKEEEEEEENWWRAT